MKCIASYAVTERSTGKLVARGYSEECAAKMGITYGSFLTIASRARRGVGKFVVTRIENDNEMRECAKRWDEAFGWFLEKMYSYPCTGCMMRSICEFSDTYCKKWEAWYRYEHGKNTKRIKYATGRTVPQK